MKSIPTAQLGPVLVSPEKIVGSLIYKPLKFTLPLEVDLPPISLNGMDLEALWLLQIPPEVVRQKQEEDPVTRVARNQDSDLHLKVDSLEKAMKAALQIVQKDKTGGDLVQITDLREGKKDRTSPEKKKESMSARLRATLEDNDIDVDDDALEDVVGELTAGNEDTSELRLKSFFPTDFMGWKGTPREQAKIATGLAMGELPANVRAMVTYPENEFPGYATKDTLDEAGDDIADTLKDLDYKDFPAHKPYVLGCGTAFQILVLCFFKNKELQKLSNGARALLLMAMDALAGMIAYGSSTIKGEHDEATRKSFLLTHGRRFVSRGRAARLFRAAGKSAKMNADQDDLLSPKKA